MEEKLQKFSTIDANFKKNGMTRVYVINWLNSVRNYRYLTSLKKNKKLKDSKIK